MKDLDVTQELWYIRIWDKNINSIDEICESINKRLYSNPAAHAALDIALFDALSKFQNISLLDFFGNLI